MPNYNDFHDVQPISRTQLLSLANNLDGNIYLFGASDLALKVKQILELFDVEIAGIYDTFKTGVFDGKTIGSVEECCAQLTPEDILLICTSGFISVAKSLEQGCINRNVKLFQTTAILLEELAIFGSIDHEEIDTHIKISQLLKTLPSVPVPSINSHITKLQPRIFAITFYGRSGSYLLSSMLDNHPQIAQLDFRSASSVLSEIFYFCREAINELSENNKFSMAKILYQLFIEENDNDKFCLFLSSYFNQLGKRSLNSYSMLELLYLITQCYFDAYEIKIDKNCVLVWQRHGRFFIEFEKFIIKENWPIMNLVMLRRPIDSLDSYVAMWGGNSAFKQHSINWNTDRLFKALIESGVQDQIGIKKIGIRFEDIHTQTEEIMRSLSNVMGIDFHETLLSSTLLGKPYLFPSGGPIPITGTDAKRAQEKKYFTGNHTLNGFSAIALRGLLQNEYKSWNYKFPRIYLDFLFKPLLYIGMFLTFLKENMRYVFSSFHELKESINNISHDADIHKLKLKTKEYELVKVVEFSNTKTETKKNEEMKY